MAKSVSSLGDEHTKLRSLYYDLLFIPTCSKAISKETVINCSLLMVLAVEWFDISLPRAIDRQKTTHSPVNEY